MTFICYPFQDIRLRFIELTEIKIKKKTDSFVSKPYMGIVYALYGMHQMLLIFSDVYYFKMFKMGPGSLKIYFFIMCTAVTFGCQL